MTTDAPSGAGGGRGPRPVLSVNERRVLGVLIEKALSTPDYYPLTLKALVAGCNQKNNRHPVLSLEDAEVEEALSALRSKRLVIAVKTDSGWATRWRHELDRTLTHQLAEQAILGELLLRGPQTEGELRTRASRMRDFKDLEEVQETLARLSAGDEPLVVRLSPEGAVRGVRHAHALYPEPELALLHEEGRSAREHASVASPHELQELMEPKGLADRVAALEARLARVAALEARLARVEAFLERELGAPAPDEGPAQEPSA